MGVERWYVPFPSEIEGRTRGVCFDSTGQWLLAWRRAHHTLMMLDVRQRTNPIRLRLREIIGLATAHPSQPEFTVFEHGGSRTITPGSTKIGKLQRLPDPAQVADYDERGHLVAIAGDAWVVRRQGEGQWRLHSTAPSAKGMTPDGVICMNCHTFVRGNR